MTGGPDEDRLRLRATSDGVAERYDEARPRYPAARGLTLTALELGPAPARVARRNLAAFPDARVIELIDRRFGGVVTKRYLAELTVARRRRRWCEPVPHRWRLPSRSRGGVRP